MRDKKPHHGDTDRLTRKKKGHDTLDLGIRLHSTNSGIFLKQKMTRMVLLATLWGCAAAQAMAIDPSGSRLDRSGGMDGGSALALIVLLSVVLQRLRVKPPRQAVKHWHFFPWLYPDTRAPPRQSAFSL